MKPIPTILKWEADHPILFFPETPTNGPRMAFYARIDGHGEATVGYYCRLPSPRTLAQKQAAAELVAAYKAHFLAGGEDLEIVKRDRSSYRRTRYNITRGIKHSQELPI